MFIRFADGLQTDDVLGAGAHEVLELAQFVEVFGFAEARDAVDVTLLDVDVATVVAFDDADGYRVLVVLKIELSDVC